MPESAPLDLLAQGTQRRARAQLSCTACRVGKLKCNRQHPACDQCIKRNKDSTCQYVAAPQRKKPNQSMKDRIKHLESLVVELYNANTANESDESPANSGELTSGTEPSDKSSPEDSIPKHAVNDASWVRESDENTRAFGRMNISKSATKYVAPSHWEAILDNIAEVRTALDEDENSSDESDAFTPESDASAVESRMQSLLHPDPTIRMNRQDLINALPPKPKTDAFVTIYFNSQSPSLCVVHRPTFQKEYARFWQNQDDAPVMWLALLLSIASIGARLQDRSFERNDARRPSKGSSSEETRRLQSLAASALILAPYTRPTTYTIEALICYLEGEYAEADDNHLEVWLMIGVTLRLALRMGFHRDFEHSQISPFEREMRRRAWCMLYTFDALLSFELGLPGMMLHLQCDVKLPQNLMDEDFGPETKVLPPPRPDSEYTNISYMRNKSRISRVFAKAAEMSHAIQPYPCTEVLQQDQRLREVHASLPATLRIKPLDECFGDPPGLIMIRFNLELLVQKTRCILHRRFLTETINGEMYTISRDNCVDAALRILRQLSTVDSAFEAGMMPHGWYMASLNTHDFLLAAMIIALDLDRRVKHSLQTPPSEDETREAEEIRSLLESTYQIWQKPIHRSNETNKACKALLIMLNKIGKPGAATGTAIKTDTLTPWSTSKDSLSTPSPHLDGLAVQPQQNIAAQLPTPAEFSTGTGLTPLPMEYNELDFAPIGNMLDMPMDMNWSTWDNYIFSQNATNDNPQRGFDAAFDPLNVNMNPLAPP